MWQYEDNVHYGVQFSVRDNVPTIQDREGERGRTERETGKAARIAEANIEVNRFPEDTNLSIIGNTTLDY